MVKPGLPDPSFWAGRRILLTGHTGFKGAWTALWLKELGAEVHGLALPPDTDPSLWKEIGAGLLTSERLCDLDNRAAIARAVEASAPELVLHMAAQALVRRSYAEPVETIATNTLGTVHLLEALRSVAALRAVLIVTTDKVYANDGAGRDFVEQDALGGQDPYSASKAAAEILTQCYAASYFTPRGIAVATARAGNVVGGGDWSKDRLMPDLWRAARDGAPLRLRSPGAIRPWQHVIEPLAGYLVYLERLVADPELPRALNFGPLPGHPMTVGAVADALCAALGAGLGWQRDQGHHPVEMATLSLDPSLAARTIGWRPRLDSAETIAWTARWYDAHRNGADARALCEAQLREFQALAGGG